MSVCACICAPRVHASVYLYAYSLLATVRAMLSVLLSLNYFHRLAGLYEFHLFPSPVSSMSVCVRTLVFPSCLFERAARSSYRSNMSGASSELDETDTSDAGYNTYSYDRRSVPITWSGKPHPEFLMKGHAVDVNHILEEAIDSPASPPRRQ